MGNSCSSIGCSENSQIQNKSIEEELEYNKKLLINEKVLKTQITYLDNKFIHVNPTENSNRKNNINGNRLLMYVKEIPTKVVQEKIKQEFNESNKLSTNNTNFFEFKDDSQFKTIIKSKSDFDKVSDSERKLFSKSVVGKINPNNKNNVLDPFNYKKNFKKTNSLSFEKTNNNYNNKNNNNDIVFIYEKEKLSLNKKLIKGSLIEHPKIVDHRAFNSNNSNLVSAENKAKIINTDNIKNFQLTSNERINDATNINSRSIEEPKYKDESNENIKNIRSNNISNIPSVESKDKLEKNNKEEINSAYKSPIKEDFTFSKINQKNNKVSLEQFLNSRFEMKKTPGENNIRKVEFKEPLGLKNKKINEKDKNKISEISLEILTYEKKKRTNVNISMEYANCSLIDNAHVVSFYIKNKNFEKPNDILNLSCGNSLIDDREKSIINLDIIKNPINHLNQKNNIIAEINDINLKRQESVIIKTVNNNINNDNHIALDNLTNQINIFNYDLSTKDKKSNELKGEKCLNDQAERSDKDQKNKCNKNNFVKKRSSSFSRKINEKLSNKPVWTINQKIFEDEKLMEFIRDPFYNYYN